MPTTGDVVSQYRLVRKIGEGGMGVVYEAVHTRIKSKHAAVKILHPAFADDQEAIARFEREAEASAAVGHEGIVDIYDLGVCDDGAPYLVMELLQGRSLADMIDPADATGPREPLDIDFTIYVACNVLSSLRAAHRVGIIHRDLKPDNVFLVDTGSALPRVMLLDFGIARMTELGGGDSGDFTLTKTGTVLGTPYFMSPEQALGDKAHIDERTDLWSLGIILYLCTTGSYPYQGENYNQLISQLVTLYSPPEPRVLNPQIPGELERVILKATSKELEQRYLSADEMFDELIKLADSETLSVIALSERRISRVDDPEEDDATLRQTTGRGQTDAPPPPLTGGEQLAATSPSEPRLGVVKPRSSVLETTPGPSVVSGSPEKQRRRGPLIAVLAVGFLLFVVVAGGAAGLAIWKADSGTDTSTVSPSARTVEPLPPPDEAPPVTPAEALVQERSKPATQILDAAVEAPSLEDSVAEASPETAPETLRDPLDAPEGQAADAGEAADANGLDVPQEAPPAGSPRRRRPPVRRPEPPPERRSPPSDYGGRPSPWGQPASQPAYGTKL